MDTVAQGNKAFFAFVALAIGWAKTYRHKPKPILTLTYHIYPKWMIAITFILLTPILCMLLCPHTNDNDVVSPMMNGRKTTNKFVGVLCLCHTEWQGALQQSDTPIKNPSFASNDRFIIVIAKRLRDAWITFRHGSCSTRPLGSVTIMKKSWKAALANVASNE